MHGTMIAPYGEYVCEKCGMHLVCTCGCLDCPSCGNQNDEFFYTVYVPEEERAAVVISKADFGEGD